jgi:hypothetical protein
MHTDAANAIFPKPCRCPFNLCQNVGCRFFPISPISDVLLLMAMKKGRSHDYKKKQQQNTLLCNTKAKFSQQVKFSQELSQKQTNSLSRALGTEPN